MKKILCAIAALCMCNALYSAFNDDLQRQRPTGRLLHTQRSHSEPRFINPTNIKKSANNYAEEYRATGIVQGKAVNMLASQYKDKGGHFGASYQKEGTDEFVVIPEDAARVIFGQLARAYAAQENK